MVPKLELFKSIPLHTQKQKCIIDFVNGRIMLGKKD
jgi:hypothetical protein